MRNFFSSSAELSFAFNFATAQHELSEATETGQLFSLGRLLALPCEARLLHERKEKSTTGECE